jgi:site-specific DNA recombinase
VSSDPGAPAVLYAAKSTEDKKGSIPTQLTDARALAEREGMSVIGEYADQAASAWKGNRGPELAAALRHAAEAGASLICQHSDRLARGDGKQARHLAELFFETSRAGITLRSVQDDSTFDSPILAVVMGERNSEDSRRKGEAVKDGLARRRALGKYIGSRPYGYRWQRNEDDERILVPEPAEAAVVQRVFDEYLGGKSQLAITRGLIADGVKTGRGGEWHQGTLRVILANPVYAGLIRDGENLIEATHEAIIEREVFEEAAQLRQAKRRTHKRGRPSAGRHLFRKGFLRCGVCGASMVPRTEPRAKGEPRETYRCYGRHRDPESCEMAPIDRVQVDAAIYSYFEQVGIDVEATRDQLAAAIEKRLAEVGALLGAAEKEARLAEERLARVKGDYSSGGLPLEDWIEFKAELEPQRDAAQAEVDRLRSQLAEVKAGDALSEVEEEVLELLAGVRAAISGAVKDAKGVEGMRSALLRLFDGFVLHRGVPDETHVELIGETWIEPRVSQRVVEGYEEKLRPVLARKPHGQAGDNYAEVLTR